MAVKITSRDELKAWLEDKPREWAQVIALRSALRVLPLSCDPHNWTNKKFNARFTSTVFRAMAVSSVASRFPADDIVRSAGAASTAVFFAVEADSGASNTASIAASAADAAVINAANHTAAAASAPFFAASAAAHAEAAPAAAAAVVWVQVSNDCVRLNDGVTPLALAGEPIWRERPDWFQAAWGRAAQWLSRPEHGFWIWREWYYGRLEGLRHAFDRFDDAADEAFGRWIVEQDDEWWKREPREVNADIKAKVEELRRPEPPSDGDLLQEQSVVNYVVDDDGTTQIAPEPLPNGVQDDQDTQDNYGEIKRLIQDALDECDPGRTQDKSMEPATLVLQASLGSQLSDLSPRLFALRAKEIIRRFEARQAGEAMIPLSQGQVDAFSPLIDALKTLAEFDPKLARLWAGNKDTKASLSREQLEMLVVALAEVKQMSPEAQETAETYLAQVDGDAGPDDLDLKKANDNVGNAVKAMGKAVKKSDDALKSADRAIRVVEKGGKMWERLEGKLPGGDTITNILEWLSKLGGSV